MKVKLKKSTRKNKKWMVILPNGKKIHFGDPKFKDFTQHLDRDRQKRYILRHAPRETWDISGICTAGFWAFWLLWSEPSIVLATKRIKQMFGIIIV